jgi:hypothetical protein
MTVPFQTTINGRPNYFIDKIWESIFRNDLIPNADEELTKYLNERTTRGDINWDFAPEDRERLIDLNEYMPHMRGQLTKGMFTQMNIENPYLNLHFTKIHTIRRSNRYKVGINLHPVINNRTKRRFQFCPTLKVVSTQTIEVKWIVMDNQLTRCEVFVDEKYMGQGLFKNCRMVSVTCALYHLIKADGFEYLEDFFDFFHEDFKGEIIHWTDWKY